MLSKLVKYNLDKKWQIYVVGQPWALPSSRNVSRNRCILPTEDEMNLFTIVTVERITFFRQSCFHAHVILIWIIYHWKSPVCPTDGVMLNQQC